MSRIINMFDVQEVAQAAYKQGFWFGCKCSAFGMVMGIACSLLYRFLTHS